MASEVRYACNLKFSDHSLGIISTEMNHNAFFFCKMKARYSLYVKQITFLL